jgi:hypothetical protein
MHRRRQTQKIQAILYGSTAGINEKRRGGARQTKVERRQNE